MMGWGVAERALGPRARWLVRARVPLALLAVAAWLGHRYWRQHLPQTTALLWGGAMLVSFVGWGSAINWLVWPKRVADWGLRAMWGVSATLLLGGLLCVLHVARTPVLLVQANLGVALAATFSIAGARAPSRRTWRVVAAAPGLGLVHGAGYAAALLWFYGNLGNGSFSEPDDYMLHFVLAKKVLATGTMFEPLAARRILGFGGQEYLQAMYLVVAPIRFIHGLDRGVFVLLTVGLVAGAFTTDGLRARYVAPLGLALLTLFWAPDVTSNSASLYSGVAALVGTWRTLRWARPSEHGAWTFSPQRMAVLGLSAVTCVVLRSWNLVPVALFLGLAILFEYVSAKRPARALVGLAATLGFLGLAMACALFPWSLLLHQSCGSFLFPMSKGYLTHGVEFLHEVDKMGEFTSAFESSFFDDHTLSSFLVLALAGMVPLRGRGAQDGAALTIASVCGLVGMAMKAAWLGAGNLPRYYFSYFVATAIALTLSSRSGLDSKAPMQIARFAVVAAAIAAQVVAGRDGARTVYTNLVANIDKIWTEPRKEIDELARGDADYKDIQSHVPQGAKVAAAVLQPFRFDFARNEIDALDQPLGGMGPLPGFPAFKGPEAVASYLLSRGIRYLVFTDFNSNTEAYGRHNWEERARADKGFLKSQASLELDMMATIEELGKTRTTVHKAGPMTLIDLGQRAAK